MSVLIAIIVIVALAMTGAVFFLWGHYEGVKETEERWDFTVRRAELNRKEGRG